MSYAEFSDYTGTELTSENFDIYAQKASDVIDTLTFFRIPEIILSHFQETVIKKVCIGFAEFLFENEEALSTTVTGYSLNGASVTYSKGLDAIKVNGTIVPTSFYNLLEGTGLTCRSMRWNVNNEMA